MSWFLLYDGIISRGITFYIKKTFSKPLRIIWCKCNIIKKNEYGSAVHFPHILRKSLVLISVQWFIGICWSSVLFGIFEIRKWVVLSLTSFGTLKYDWLIKTRQIFNFLPLINNSVTIEFNFLFLIISAIISSKTINVLRSLFMLYSSIFF